MSLIELLLLIRLACKLGFHAEAQRCRGAERGEERRELFSTFFLCVFASLRQTSSFQRADGGRGDDC